MFEVGDPIKGLPGAPYTITDEKMTRGLVTDVTAKEIRVKVLKHESGKTGSYWVSPQYFEKVGNVKSFVKQEVIKQIEAEGTKVLLEYDLRCADLSGVNLRYADLSGVNLSGASLRYACLNGANLRYACLNGANLRYACLNGANLGYANLNGANLSGVNLRYVDLSGANLRRADLNGADLSGAKGLIDAIDYLRDHFERTEEGYIVYKSFGTYRDSPTRWKIEPGEIIKEVVNPNRTDTCGSGINVAPLDWVKQDNDNPMYKLLIRYEWLSGVVVPYNTDGKIRCSRAQIIEKVA